MFKKLATIVLGGFLLMAPFGVFFPALGAYNPASLIGLTTVVELRAQTFNPTFYPYLYTIGYNTAFDGGGGLVAAHSGTTDNGCTKFKDSQNHEFDRVGAGTALTVNQCGAYGDDTHDDHAAFSAAFGVSTQVNCTPGSTYYITGQITGVQANTVWDCSGATIDLNIVPANIQFMDIEVSNVLVQNVRLVGHSNTQGAAGFEFGITSTIRNLKFNNIIMDSSAHPDTIVNDFLIGSASNVEINHCTLRSTGYGLLQVSGDASNYVKVDGCTVDDMFSDFIEQNGTSVGSTRWTISHNIFLSSHDWPTAKTEERFAGFTDINDLIISANNVADAAGDACVHVEGPAGNISLTGNTFVDCQVNGGNDGYIYMLDAAGWWVSTGNTFVYTGNGGGAFAFSTVSGSCADCNLSSTGDTFIDTAGGAFGGYDLESDSSGQLNLTGSTVISGKYLLIGYSTNNLSVVGANVLATSGIVYLNDLGAGGTGGTNVSVSGSNFQCTLYCILSEPNTTPTGPPTNWSITSNHFSGTATGGVKLTGAVNSWCQGNWYGSGLTSHTCANSAGTDTVDYKNFLQGTGVVN